ncbi:MAG TPA: hypothetical protein VFR17_10485 [Mycobacterium sp.]|nr:hypothetical protein [Mycobacterium sp.]
MIRQTKKYQLPDHGFTLVRWAHDIAHGRTAVVVDREVERARRPDGALTVADLSAFRRAKDGPLTVLRTLLELEATEVRRWSKAGFARFHKRSAGKQVERLCQQRGIEAAVDWVLENGSSDRLQLEELRDLLGPRLYRTGAFDEEFFKGELSRAILERRKQHQLKN